MNIHPFFHRSTGTLTYLITRGSHAAVIDPVLDFQDGVVTSTSLQQIIDEIESQGVTLDYILETHIHADHLTGSKRLQQHCGGKTVISKRIVEVYDNWRDKLQNEPLAAFDLLVEDGDELPFGDHVISVLATPGHTPTDLTFALGENIFVGDTLFAPARGTARVDFPGGSASTLYHSIKRLFSLPDNTNVYLCHDYPQDSDEPVVSTTLATQKADNVMLNDKVSEQEYSSTRLTRDATLAAPKLLPWAIPYNLTYHLPNIH
ncbi:MBL fold metallo-hydrolase [Vibrio hangzhouensis]|uniref:Glyoxylase, beta-lactamase superfamily II n=1 Tax=Vibrio hangzhouensis TaxID=462991 RepID=A0A1H6CF47_9VIBR|nr:MBL fold metallo-hydrolase [Vibrio hangzhouensis]SEG71631.1 Glyoxylase, beta-lactamase superfamily II [Vibrio hangzhouensis]